LVEQSETWVCSRSLAVIVGLDTTGGTYVSLLVVLCVSGRDLYVGLITRPEESYHVCVCVCVCVCVSLSEIRCNSNPQHLQCARKRGDTKKEN